MDATSGVPSDSANTLPSDSPFDKEEPKEKDSTNLVDPSSPRDCSSPPSAERVHRTLPYFPHRLKKKIKLMLIKTKKHSLR